MKGYRRKLLVRPGAPELAARQKKREEEQRAIEELLKHNHAIEAENVQAGAVTGEAPTEAKDATQP